MGKTANADKTHVDVLKHILMYTTYESSNTKEEKNIIPWPKFQQPSTH